MSRTDKEVWKVIPFTANMYYVSSLGRVGSKQGIKPRILKPSKDTQGYCIVGVRYTYNNKVKSVKVHRLVGLLHVENPYELIELNHKDGIKHNNVATNLKYVTHAENVQHAYDTGLTRTIQVVQYTLKGIYIKEYKSISEASKQTGVNPGSIYYALNGVCSHGKGYIWKNN